MGRAGDDTAALDDLRFHWGEAYRIGFRGGAWAASRRDGQGGTLTDPAPEGLLTLIRADYAAMPVPRDRP
jgi:hypothetical protein